MISSKTFATVLIVFTVLAAPAGAFNVVGHRGGGRPAPDNTINAFKQGAAIGADVVEADVTMTKDMRVIVRHDLRVGLCTGPYQRRFFKNLTLAQVRRLDCGAGTHIPLLEQIYRAVPTTRVLVEVKLDPYQPRATYAPRVVARHVVDTIRGAKAVRRTTVQSFDWRVLREIARREPRLRLQALANDVTLFPGSRWLGGVRVRHKPFRSGLPSAVQRAGFDAMAVSYGELNARLVQAAHARRLAISTFTVDNPTRMDRAIGLGVDGIITNYPDRLLHEARAAGLRR